MYTLTKDNVREHFTAILVEKGSDYRYAPDTVRGRGCVYVDDSGPSCIIGQLLSRVGVPLDVIEHLDTAALLEDEEGDTYEAPDTALGTLFDNGTLYGFGIEIEDDNLETVLVHAQSQQDVGIAYGDIIAEALDSLSDTPEKTLD
jgi:hypothetical protein